MRAAASALLCSTVALLACADAAPRTAPRTAPAEGAMISTPPAASPPPTAIELAANDGGFSLAYCLSETPAPLNDPFDAEVWITRGTTDDLVLEIDARMPHHKHGMNVRPTITKRDDGSYLVEGLLLHMPGYWEMYFDVTRGGLTERAQTSMELD